MYADLETIVSLHVCIWITQFCLSQSVLLHDNYTVWDNLTDTERDIDPHVQSSKIIV